MNRTIIVALAIGAVVASAAVAACSLAPILRQPALEAKTDRARTLMSIKGARVQFAPGQPSGLHLPHVPMIGVVTRGSFFFQSEGQPARTLRQGDAFYEPAGVRSVRFGNASSLLPAEIEAFCLPDESDAPMAKILS